jgi:hypothetical protein
MGRDLYNHNKQDLPAALNHDKKKGLSAAHGQQAGLPTRLVPTRKTATGNHTIRKQRNSIYLSMYVRMYIYIYMYVCLCICMYVYAHVCARVCVYVWSSSYSLHSFQYVSIKEYARVYYCSSLCASEGDLIS